MNTDTMISVTANGEPYRVEAGTSLLQFLEQCGFKRGQVVVERNRQALSPSRHEATVLEDGDRLEIVRIVAGG